MPKEKLLPADTSGDVPAWFMTYSDVITLLMTFFILLLTFASQEPEKFERMKVSMFGGGGSDGIAGKKNDAMDRESVLLRYRPEKSRLTSNGSETPPENLDASRDGLSEGLKALEERNENAATQRITFKAARNQILNRERKLTSAGRKQLAEMAKQIVRFNMKLTIAVADPSDLPAGTQIAHDMSYGLSVPLGRVSVATQANPDSNSIEFTLTRDIQP